MHDLFRLIKRVDGSNLHQNISLDVLTTVVPNP